METIIILFAPSQNISDTLEVEIGKMEEFMKIWKSADVSKIFDPKLP